MNKNKKWLMALSVATLITANSIALVATAAPESADQAQTTQQAAFGKGEFKGGMKAFAQGKAKLLEFLKIDENTLKAEMKSGKTLVAIAQEQGITEQQLKDFIITQVTQRIDDSVKAGKITADKADKIKSGMDQRVTDMINGKGHMGGHGPRMGMFNDAKLLQLLNIDANTLKSEMQAGKTLLDIAQEHGVTEQQLKDLMVSEMTARIDAAVQAGKITTDKADKMKANMDQRVTNMINGKGHMHDANRDNA